MSSLGMTCLVLLLAVVLSNVESSEYYDQMVNGVSTLQNNVFLLVDPDDDNNGLGAFLGLKRLAARKLALMALTMFTLPVPGPDGTIMTAGQSLVMNAMNVLGMDMTMMNNAPNSPIMVNTNNVLPSGFAVPCMQPDCPEGFEGVVNGNCYFIRRNGRTRRWGRARNDCGGRNAVLWEPETEMEVRAVTMLFRLEGDEVWTGASERRFDGTEGSARFTSGRGLGDFAMDGRGACSNTQSRDCVALTYTESAGAIWCFQACSTQHIYVCEFTRTTCI